jgi:hypothetical protein
MRFRRLLVSVMLALLASLFPVIAGAQAVTPLNTTPLGVTLPNNQGLNATDSSIPLATGTNTALFKASNVIKIDSEYFLITAVNVSTQDNPGQGGFTGYSTLTVARAQHDSAAAAHAANAPILRVYQLEVLLGSPNSPISAYQLSVSYGSGLSLVSANVFPGDGVLGTPVAVNTKTSGTLILNSFDASASFGPAQSPNPKPVARVYFTGTAAGPATLTVNLSNIADATGNDLDAVSNGATTTLSATTLTVSSFTVRPRPRGQVTSQ